MKVKLKMVKNLKNLERRVNAVKNMYDKSFLTGKISKDMEKEVGIRFRREVDPEGRPWKGLNLNSLFRRQGLTLDEGEVKRFKRNGWKNSQIERAFKIRKGRVSELSRSGSKKTKRRPKILQDTGRLKRSIHSRHTQTEAIVGTNVKYAAVHNFGSSKRNVPQRRFMGLNNAQRMKYREWIIKWKKGQLK